MSAELNLAATVASGGAAGSIMALVAGYIRDKRKESMIKTRAKGACDA